MLAKSWLSTGNCSRKRFLISTRKPNGMRRPSEESAMTRYVSPPAEACDGEYSEGAEAM
jgi:hypothetical protein